MNNKLKKAIASLFLGATLLTARTSVHAMPVSFTIHMKEGFLIIILLVSSSVDT